MEQVKNVIVAFLILLFIALWAGLTAYGVIHVWQYSDVKEEKQFQASRIEHLQERMAVLREEVYILNSCIRWEIVLSETLSSQEKVELDVIEASLRNKIQRSFSKDNTNEKRKEIR